jgi:hypothetical protein
MLRLKFFLPYFFPFDTVFDIESTQTGHGNLLVYKLAVEKYTALL